MTSSELGLVSPPYRSMSASAVSLNASKSASSSTTQVNPGPQNLESFLQGSRQGSVSSVSGPSNKIVRVLTQTHFSTKIEPSLYPTCYTILARLRKIPQLQSHLNASVTAYENFKESAVSICPNLHSAATVSTAIAAVANVNAIKDTSTLQANSSSNAQQSLDIKPYLATIGSIPLSMDLDPVSHIWSFLRMGSSLCALFNVLEPKTPLNTTIKDDLKFAKRAVYDFVHACKQELSLPDSDLFTISNVFSDNTTDLLKVIKTVQLLLETLEMRGRISPTVEEDILQDPEASDKRSKIVEELVQTERRYVQDMEELCRYQNILQSNSSVSHDLVHGLFPNLSQLMDFQRRILVAFEYHAQLAAEKQRFGSVFEILQDGFAVYEGYALNQKNACDLALSEIDRLRLQPVFYEFSFDLGSTLIKPIQRICKYPLLLQSLQKNTPPEWTTYGELGEGLETIKYITTEVNETQRRVENSEIVKDLQEQIRDWRGHRVEDFGELLHDGKFAVVKSDVEREYHLYLFENIILCCKPAPLSKKPVLKKGFSSSSFSASQMSLGGAGSRKRESLVLKGRIYMAYITDVVASRSGGYMLHISWGKDNATDTGYFDIKFRHVEALNQWESTIKRMLARYQESARDYYQYGLEQQISQGTLSYQSMTNSSGTIPAKGGQFSGPRRSYTESDDDLEYVPGIGDSQFSPTSEFENGNSRSMSTSSRYAAAFNSLSEEVSGLNLGNKKPESGSTVSLASTASSVINGFNSTMVDNGPPTSVNMTAMFNTRNRSVSSPNKPLANGAPPTQQQQQQQQSAVDSNAASRVRSEGANLPSSYVLRGPAPLSTQVERERERVTGSQDSSSSSSSSMASRSISGSFSSLTGATSVSSNGGPVGTSNPASYISTLSTVVGGSSSSVNSIGGATSVAPSVSKTPSTQMKVKLHFQDDTFLLIVPTTIQYVQLLERVERKIRLCGRQTASPLRMRYKDEDDDFVTINNDEDIQMALELSQQEGLQIPANTKGLNDTLTVWAA